MAYYARLLKLFSHVELQTLDFLEWQAPLPPILRPPFGRLHALDRQFSFSSKSRSAGTGISQDTVTCSQQ